MTLQIKGSKLNKYLYILLECFNHILINILLESIYLIKKLRH